MIDEDIIIDLILNSQDLDTLANNITTELLINNMSYKES